MEGERPSNPVLQAAGLRLSWFSFPSPQLNKGYEMKALIPQPTTVSCSVQRDHREAGTVKQLLSVGRWLPHSTGG